MLDKETIQANLQSHFTKAADELKANQDVLTDTPDLSIEEIIALYERQRSLEGSVNWISNVDAALFPKSIIPATPQRNGMGVVK